MKRPVTETLFRILPGYKTRQKLRDQDDSIQLLRATLEDITDESVQRLSRIHELETTLEACRKDFGICEERLKAARKELSQVKEDCVQLEGRLKAHEVWKSSLSLEKREEILRAFSMAAKDDRMMRAIQALIEGLHDEVYAVACSPDASEREGIVKHACGGVYYLSLIADRIGQVWADAHKNDKIA